MRQGRSYHSLVTAGQASSPYTGTQGPQTQASALPYSGSISGSLIMDIAFCSCRFAMCTSTFAQTGSCLCWDTTSPQPNIPFSAWLTSNEFFDSRYNTTFSEKFYLTSSLGQLLTLLFPQFSNCLAPLHGGKEDWLITIPGAGPILDQTCSRLSQCSQDRRGTPPLKLPQVPKPAVSGARPWALGAGVEAAGTIPPLLRAPSAVTLSRPSCSCSKAGQVEGPPQSREKPSVQSTKEAV